MALPSGYLHSLSQDQILVHLYNCPTFLFRRALGNLRRPDILRPFLLVTANFMFVDKIHLFFSLLLFKDLTLLCLHLTSSSFVMFAGPFAMIFYGVQIFKETGSNIQNIQNIPMLKYKC